MSVIGDFMVGTYQNQYADGTTSKRAALLRFNADNQAVEVVAIPTSHEYSTRLADRSGAERATAAGASPTGRLPAAVDYVARSGLE